MENGAASGGPRAPASKLTEAVRQDLRSWIGKQADLTLVELHWRTLAVLGAICQSGWVATMTIETATDGDIFPAYVEQVLGPQLRPGDVGDG